jgi:hypothetical protein
VPRASFVLLPFVLVAAIARAQMDEVSRASESEPHFKDAVVGSALTRSPLHTLVIPSRLLENARLKARLLVGVRDSLYDDAHGILNTAREKEIRKPANRVRNEKDDYWNRSADRGAL